MARAVKTSKIRKQRIKEKEKELKRGFKKTGLSRKEARKQAKATAGDVYEAERQKKIAENKARSQARAASEAERKQKQQDADAKFKADRQKAEQARLKGKPENRVTVGGKTYTSQASADAAKAREESKAADERTKRGLGNIKARRSAGIGETYERTEADGTKRTMIKRDQSKPKQDQNKNQKPSSGKSEFGKTFAKERKKQGAGGEFAFKGKRYTTNLKEEEEGKMAKHGGALAIMIAPVKGKKMKAVKKADNGASTDPVKKKKAYYKKGTLKKLSAREKRISRNTEFNEYARKKGIIPNFYKIPYGEPGYEDQKERMKKFYSNKENLKMIEREQDKYFKNKEMKPVKKGAHGAKVKEAMYGAKMKKAMYGAKMKKAEMGAKLKEVPSDNKGLSKLPKKVRNKMGYMKNGGKLKRKKRNKIKMSREEFVAKQREISMRNELKENSKNPDSKKRADARTQNQLDRAMRANQIKKTKDKAGKGGYDKMMYGGAMKKAMYGAKMKKKAMYGAKMKK